MQYYAIEYTETRTATFNVQADSYEDACERFAEETKRKIAAVRKRSEQLIKDITQLEN